MMIMQELRNTQKMPFLSIIVPVYNKVNYIDACIVSILEQTYSDFELILVDDGSTDGSGNKCDHYGKIDHRVTVLHQLNMGVSAARNNGLAVCKGKFIGFVDSDDYLEKDMYELLINNAINSGSDISICGIMRIYGNQVKNNRNDMSIAVYEGDDGLYEVLTGLFDMSANNKIFRSEIARSILFEGGFKEDLLYNVRAFLKTGRVVFQNTSKYIYELRENSVSVKKFSTRDMEGLMIDKKIIEMVAGRDERIIQEAQKNFFVQNLSTLNLILLFSDVPYPDDYNIITGNLKEYSFLISGKVLKIKHRLAYLIFSFSPSLYRNLLKLYVVFVPSEVGIRDK